MRRILEVRHEILTVFQHKGSTFSIFSGDGGMRSKSRPSLHWRRHSNETWAAPGFLLCGGRAKGIGGKTGHVLRASSYTWGHVGAAGGQSRGHRRAPAPHAPDSTAHVSHTWDEV